MNGNGQNFFLAFIKEPPLRLSAEEYAIKLFTLKLCLRDYLAIEVC